MSKHIILPNTPFLQRGGSIQYHLRKSNQEISLQVSATDQDEADFLFLAGVQQILARIIQSAEEAPIPEELEEGRQLYLDDLRNAYNVTKSINEGYTHTILQKFKL